MSYRLLEETYRLALDQVAPERVVSRWWKESGGLEAQGTIAIGKCAAGMLEGLPQKMRSNAFVAVPRGYPLPISSSNVWTGGHPLPDESSLAAGDALVEFLDHISSPVLCLLSGGSSACIDVIDDSVIDRNAYFEIASQLVRSGAGIDEMNAVRARISRIKGGRLGMRLPPGSVVLIVSDVHPDRPRVVGSGPTFARGPLTAALKALRRIGTEQAVALHDRLATDEEKTIEPRVKNIVVADNHSLLAAAASVFTKEGLRVFVYPRQIEDDVAAAAKTLATLLPEQDGLVVVAGGEPTVEVRGGGVGGRCSELALHVLATVHEERKEGSALIGSSDGVDGSSPAAAFLLTRRTFAAGVDRGELETALADSNSYPLAARVAEPIMMPATGNNLRDIYLLARS